MLVNTINSVIDQCDRINVCLNNYDFNPYPDEKVNVIFADNTLGDAGKFLFCSQEEGYYLTLDDDLIVSDTYVSDMVVAIEEYGIVTHHGRSFDSFPIGSYYRSSPTRFRCLDEVKETQRVQFAGTGCLGFHTNTIKPPIDIFERKNLADIYFSLYCKKLGLPIYVLEHEKGYFQYQYPEDTIWDRKHRSDEFETTVVNNFFTKKR